MPLDPTILNQVLMFINLTLPDSFIRQWIRAARPHLECESVRRKKLEEKLKQVIDETPEFTGIPPFESSVEKMFPHEFLFLVINGYDRS